MFYYTHVHMYIDVPRSEGFCYPCLPTLVIEEVRDSAFLRSRHLKFGIDRLGAIGWLFSVGSSSKPARTHQE